MTPRRTSALPVLLVSTLALAGCVATPTPTPTPSASPPTSTLPTASTGPTTEPSAAPAVTCDTVFTLDAYAKLANDGLEPRDPHMWDPLATQMVEAGGLACTWGRPQTDIGLTVTQLSDIDPAVWASALADAGFIETNDPVAGAYTGTVDSGSGISPVVVVTGDSMTFVSVPTFAGWIAPVS
jgi:hypothetical protein